MTGPAVHRYRCILYYILLYRNLLLDSGHDLIECYIRVLDDRQRRLSNSKYVHIISKGTEILQYTIFIFSPFSWQ